jgi:hypothetical protein
VREAWRRSGKDFRQYSLRQQDALMNLENVHLHVLDHFGYSIVGYFYWSGNSVIVELF